MKRPAPKPPATRDMACKCGHVNRYRTVCINCSADLPNRPDKERPHEKKPQDTGMVSPGIPIDSLHRRDRADAGFLDTGRDATPFAKYLIYAFAAVVAFFGFLNLVSDQPKPSITFTADSTPPACPIKHACDNL